MDCFPLKVDKITDVPGGVKRPLGDKGAVYNMGNPLSFEKYVKRGHKGQGTQEYKEGKFYRFPFKERHVVEPMNNRPEDGQTDEYPGIQVVSMG